MGNPGSSGGSLQRGLPSFIRKSASCNVIGRSSFDRKIGDIKMDAGEWDKAAPLRLAVEHPRPGIKKLGKTRTRE
jgi:hypothetical protein